MNYKVLNQSVRVVFLSEMIEKSWLNISGVSKRMRTITCYIINREETTEIPVEVFEAHARAVSLQGKFIESHPPLVLLTTEGLGFAALYEVDGRVKVEMFRYAEYPALPKDHPVHGWLTNEINLVEFEEVKEAVESILPIVDQVLVSSMLSQLDPRDPSVLN